MTVMALLQREQASQCYNYLRLQAGPSAAIFMTVTTIVPPYTAALPVYASSLAPGSATLGIVPVIPDDVLIATFGSAFSPVPYASGASLGMVSGDNVNGLDVVLVPESSAVALLGVGCLSGLFRRKRA